MKTNRTNILCLIFSFISLFSCNNQDHLFETTNEQEKEEYLKALQLITNFSDVNSRSNNIKILEVKQQAININKSIEDLHLYTFIFENDGKKGFAIASGDKRIPQIIAYVENGTIADTTNIPAMAFILKNISQNIKQEILGHNKSRSLSRNPDNFHLVDKGPFVKTTWDTGTPYNNNYPNGNCSGNNKFRASTTAIALAQAIIANPKRPQAFPFTYEIEKWVKKKTVEATDPYVSQVAEFIKFLEPAGITYGCNASYSDLLSASSILLNYGYSEASSSFLYKNYTDYAIIARNLEDGYCTVVSGTSSQSGLTEYYSWIIDGFKGKLNEAETKAEVALIHCVYGYGGKGDGWYKNPFNPNAAGGGNSDVNQNIQFIHFQEIK